MCRSSKVDVDAVFLDGQHSPNNVNAFLVELTESVLSVLILWPLCRRWVRRNDSREEARLVEQIARTEGELKALSGDREGRGDAPYRGR